MKNEKEKLICQNKKASHDYFLLDTFEAGIKLKGTEIKSIREGKTNINEKQNFLSRFSFLFLI